MFFRLKSTHVAHGPDRAATPIVKGEWLSSSLRKHLNDRLITTFDWQQGATRGPIQFVDYHLLELCHRRAMNHEAIGTAMLSRMMQCAERLSNPMTGAMHQYATRLGGTVTRGYATLLGQAVALRACVLAESLIPQSRALGDAVLAFVERTGIQHLDASDPHALDAQAPSGFALWRRYHYFWYLIALNEFALTRGLSAAANNARRSASAVLESSYATELSIRHADIHPTFLDEVVALIALGEYYHHYGLVANLPGLFDGFAAVLTRYRVATGGYGRLPLGSGHRDAIVDIDLTIEIVRLATRLIEVQPSGPWRAIQRHGLAALGQPAIALARTVEAGILLIDDELSHRTRTTLPAPNNNRAATSRPKSLNPPRIHPPRLR